MFIIAAVAYALSIFIDVAVYHFKYYIQDNKNIRHLFSMINIFQYSARFFILIFSPIMSYLVDSVKDKDEVWFVTILAHFFVVLFLLLLYSNEFSSYFSTKVINVLNIFFGKSKPLELECVGKKKKSHKRFILSYSYLFLTSYIAGFLFSVSITFLYFISFSYPQKALMLSSGTQIINMFGSMLLILFVDPRIMGAIDEGRGHQEIMILTTSRVLVHITLILVLFYIK